MSTILNGLIETSELEPILGLSDRRSIMAWLRKHKAPIVVLGRKTYTQLQFIEDMVTAALGGNNTSRNTLDDIRSNRNVKVAKPLIKVADAPKRTENNRAKSEHSKASVLLLNNIHSA